MQKTVNELVKRIKRLEDSKNIAVVYHFDIDGCASASIIWRLFQKQGINAVYIPATRGFEEMVIGRIKKENPDKIILVDYIPGDDFVDFLKDYNTEILDHHVHEKRLEIFDYFTSTDFEISASISYLLYLAAKKLGIKDTEWLARLGAFWDKCMEQTEFFEEDIYKNEFEKFFPFNLVVCLSQTKGSEKMFELMNSSNSMEEAMENVQRMEDYTRAREIFDKEIRDIEFSRKAYPDIKLNLFWVKTIFKHIRIYVDYITYRTPGTHIFILDENTRFKFSFRTSLDIDLTKILDRIREENPKFNGGGHLHACGGILFSENVEELLDKFIEYYRNIVSPGSSSKYAF